MRFNWSLQAYDDLCQRPERGTPVDGSSRLYYRTERQCLTRLPTTGAIAFTIRVYLHPLLNRGAGHKLATMARMVADYDADGVILHSDRSCKPYSIGQMGQAEALSREVGVPALLLEADHNDPRSFSEQQVNARLDAFLEIVESG